MNIAQGAGGRTAEERLSAFIFYDVARLYQEMPNPAYKRNMPVPRLRMF